MKKVSGHILSGVVSWSFVQNADDPGVGPAEAPWNTDESKISNEVGAAFRVMDPESQ